METTSSQPAPDTGDIQSYLAGDGEKFDITAPGIGAPAIRKFTEEYRQAELARGEASLFYFAQAILGFDRLTDLQYDLCSFLEGRKPHGAWQQAVVCAYRGSYKSTVTTQALPLWRTLYIPDFSVKIIENSSDNAKNNHFLPMVLLFTSSPRADYLRWLYQHRFPEKAWANSERIRWKQTNPLSAAAISYWGVESKFEGWHGNLIIMDDIEGADAEKSQVHNENAARTWSQCIPLLEEPSWDQMLLVGTPWGNNPIVYQLRDREKDDQGKVILDNEKRDVKLWWKPIVNEKGDAYEPHRYYRRRLESLAKEDIFDTQFMLKRGSSDAQVFKVDAIERYRSEWADPAKQIIRYPTFEFDIKKLSEDGYVIPEMKPATVRVADLRPYIHVDPTHRLDEQMRNKNKSRPSRGAIVVVGVAPDHHVFPLEWWAKNAEIDELALEVMRLARKWRAHRITFESIGAQVWFTKFVEQYEKIHRMQQVIAIQRGQAPSDSMRVALKERIVEANKTNQSKEWVFRERLAPWVNHGLIHFNPIDHHIFLSQMESVTDESVAVDLIDALSQGPEIWEPPMVRDRVDALLARREYVRTYGHRGKLTTPLGYGKGIRGYR